LICVNDYGLKISRRATTGKAWAASKFCVKIDIFNVRAWRGFDCVFSEKENGEN